MILKLVILSLLSISKSTVQPVPEPPTVGALILSILVFYLICLKDISYIYAFAVITLGCFISLVYSYLFVSKHHLLKYKKK